jgi:flagellar FliJ protein
VAFTFRLETVLRHRRHEEEARAAALAGAERRLQGVEDRLTKAERRLAAALVSTGAPTGAPVQVGDLMAKTRWLNRLDSHRMSLEAERQRRLVERDECRAGLEAAWRQREMLEHLKRRQESEHRARAARRERVAMDEIGSIRHAMLGPA